MNNYNKKKKDLKLLSVKLKKLEKECKHTKKKVEKRQLKLMK